MQEKAVITVGTKFLNRGEGMGFSRRTGDALGQKQTVQPFSKEKKHSAQLQIGGTVGKRMYRFSSYCSKNNVLYILLWLKNCWSPGT